MLNNIYLYGRRLFPHPRCRIVHCSLISKAKLHTLGRSKLTRSNLLIVNCKRNFSVEEFIEVVTDNVFVQTIQHYINVCTNTAFVDHLSKLFVVLHDFSGLGWLGTIVAGAVLTRAALFPMLRRHHINVRDLREIHSAILPKLRQAVYEAVKENHLGWSKSQIILQCKKQIRNEVQEMYKTKKCQPTKVLYIIPAVQLVIWAPLSLAMLKITTQLDDQKPQLRNSGILWFKDLILPDPILPAILTILLYANTEFGKLDLRKMEKAVLGNINQLAKTAKIQEQVAYESLKHNAMQGIMRRRFWLFCYRSGAAIAAAVALAAPAGVVVFWTVAAILGFAQHLAFRVPKTMKLLKIPRKPTDSPKPMKEWGKSVFSTLAFIVTTPLDFLRLFMR